MAESIWVLAEQWRGRISDGTYEALALGREVAEGLGLPLRAALLGDRIGELPAALGAADSIAAIEHPALAETIPGVYADALAQAVPAETVRLFLVPLTNVSLGIGTLLAAEWKTPAINFCKDVRVAQGKLEACCLLYGGKIEVRVACGQSAVLGLWPGARPADRGRVQRVVPVERPAFTPMRAPGVRFRRYIEPQPGDIDITRYDVLVAVGRGINGQENIGLAEELATTLGGAVCGSRPVIDQGWLPLPRQVGKSGHTVKAKLYLALGISGAPEHVEGMKDSELIVAVNSDPRAPIFGIAHYGIVADAAEVASALAKAVKERREAAHA
jgi:electron transfer flavoprotein alpha subunit